MIRETLPTTNKALTEGRTVRSVDLYESFVSQWLRRDDGKHNIIADHKLLLMTHLAWEVWRSGSRTWSASWMEEWMLEFIDSHEKMKRHYTAWEPDLWKQDLRTATFLTLRNNTFSFAHSSLLEYFLAVRLSDSLLADSPGHHPTFQRVLRILHGTRGQIRRHHTQPGDHSARTGWTLWEYKRSQERLFLHPASDGASRTTPAPEHTRPVGYGPARVDYRIETLPSGPQRSTVARCQAR